MTTHSRGVIRARSLRRRKLLKKKLTKDDISVNSTSSMNITGSLASAMSVGLITVADSKAATRNLR